ncbi:hypothetical protein SKAU_G00033210 [Synaphobranchus kaupii]|uniref:Uncharacterized protein n=1 Tax=Synaphobranchus kaupii TaxID=118154 RepID=A0A9Q1JEE3_SYNKA|nr:hypothetical protein SKAU_G00033210 [Synaphobranchus kaupii]
MRRLSASCTGAHERPHTKGAAERQVKGRQQREQKAGPEQRRRRAAAPPAVCASPTPSYNYGRVTRSSIYTARYVARALSRLISEPVGRAVKLMCVPSTSAQAFRVIYWSPSCCHSLRPWRFQRCCRCHLLMADLGSKASRPRVLGTLTPPRGGRPDGTTH